MHRYSTNIHDLLCDYITRLPLFCWLVVASGGHLKVIINQNIDIVDLY